MDPKLKIKISRNGVEIGEEELQNIESKLKSGVLKITDHYWHEGMTQWEPIPKLLQIIDKAKKEQLAKAQKEEELKRQKYEAKRDELERNNYYKCGCCRISFENPEGLSVRFIRGTVSILSSYFLIIIMLVLLGSRRTEEEFFTIFGVLAVLALALLFISGVGYILAAFVRSPSCPKCGSSNFAKPEKPEHSPNK